MDNHVAAVSSISAQVRRFQSSGTPFRIYHGSTNSTRTVIRDPSTSIDISSLNNILSIDKDKLLAIVEPNVPMDALVKATLEYGLIPPVIPEFPGITVGGGFAGGAGESSSFKYGFLDATVEEVEVVLGDGRILEVGANGNAEEAELFHGLAGTLGTLGVLTRLTIRLVEAKPFVEMTYRPVSSFKQAKVAIEDAMAETSANDFVDGIMFSSSKGAIVTGRFVSETHGGPITRFSRSTDEWYYLHAEEMISKSRMSGRRNGDLKEEFGEAPAFDNMPAVDYVPLTDYLFRYDRGAFWMGKYGCKHFLLPFTKTTRTLLDSLFHTREMYTALHASKMQQYHIVEDLAVPIKNTVPWLEYLEEDFGIYPLWLCPLKFKQSGLTIKHVPNDTEMLLNVGVWGPYTKKHTSFKSANLALEAKVKDLQGIKWLYAQTFYEENEFWNIYDRESYEGLRRKFAATQLPNFYDKVKQPDRKAVPLSFFAELWEVIFGFWLIGGLWGLYQAWRRANFVLKR